MSDSVLDEVLKRTNTVEKKEILVDLIDTGMGIEPDDLMLKLPGLANHFRGIAQALEAVTKSIPSNVYQQVGQRLDEYETTLSERITLQETMLGRTLAKIETFLTERTKLDENNLSSIIKQIETVLAAQETLSQSLQKIETAKVQAYSPPKNQVTFRLSGFSPMSAAISTVPALLIVGLVSWFHFIPAEVARRHSVDRQSIERYLQSNEGKSFLKSDRLKSRKSK